MATTSQVRVGVRVRPLTPQEIIQGGKQVVQAVAPTVGIGQRRFTYDAVFDSDVTQADLFESVSGPLLRCFLDGYNATIMAYGQTGSGKTFTMGSEAHSEGELVTHPGLIPRFMSEIFEQLRGRKTESDAGTDKSGQVLLDYRISASFLEVYGEDVHDLLDQDRKTLPLREDSTGGVVVAGLTSRWVSNASEAINVLHEGTMNRTTAATLMNLTSSRSHAVFTITLQQTCRSSDAGDVEITTTSRFTFVDLAGSERMKKTGAEGERAREGIKINEGLLALGNVINALADDERLVKDKKVHVPYRQSKLTRLLQDALGGNSQTLFLACVSPADTNASETLSTLHYANRARNIKNAPTKNVDATVMELQRLHALTHVLECELVKHRFEKFSPTVPGSIDEEIIGVAEESLMNRQDVQDYIQLLYRTAEERRGTFAPRTLMNSEPPPSNELSLGSGMSRTPSKSLVPNIATTSILQDEPSSTHQHILEKIEDSLLEEVNPEEEMAILDQLLELQHHDHEYDKLHKSDEAQLKLVQGELDEQEAMLLQLRESLKVYHSMKEKYEVLMGEVQQLEAEKAVLAHQLEKATADPSEGCSLAIKKKLEKVELSLARARNETRKHQQMYRKAEQEAQKCRALEKKIQELKHGKVALMKKQKEAAVRHREYTEAKTREIMALKRRERTTGTKVSKLEAEIQIHKNNLEKRKTYCDKLSEKLNQTESHLMKLLAIRKRELYDRTSMLGPSSRRSTCRPPSTKPNTGDDAAFAPKSEEIISLIFMLDKMIADRVNSAQVKRKYEERVAEYSELMRSMVSEVRSLSAAKQEIETHYSDDGALVQTLQQHEQNVEDLELKLELVGSELDDLRPKVVTSEGTTTQHGMAQDSFTAEDPAMKVLVNLTPSVLRTLLRETFQKLVENELECQRLSNSMQRKESALHGFESEVYSLNAKLVTLSTELAQRRALSKSEVDPFDRIQRLTTEKSAMEQEAIKARNESNDMIRKLNDLKGLLETTEVEKREAKEKLTLAEAILRQREGVHQVESVVDNLQVLWKELGVSSIEREEGERQIQFSLEDTCKRKLDEALAQKETTQKMIDQLRNEILSMCKVLGRQQTEKEWELSSNGTLLTILDSLQNQANQIRPEFNRAIERRAKLVVSLEGLLASLGSRDSDLSQNLSDLVLCHKRYTENLQNGASSPDIQAGQSHRANMLRNVEDIVNALDHLIANDNTGEEAIADGTYSAHQIKKYEYGPRSALEPTFLDSCEKEITQLRLLKSERLAQNSLMRDDVYVLTKDMLLSTEDVVQLAEESIKRDNSLYPDWWSHEMVERVAKTITRSDTLILANSSFSRHLEFIKGSASTMAESRSILSNALKQVVDRAQQTLLNTVDGEVDASEAYASFHDALFRLPTLSKEHICACINELRALVAGVEAMTQSEVEALTIVWEALNVSSAERGGFWAELEETTSALELKTDSPFDEMIKNDSITMENWMMDAVNNARNVYRVLNVRLFKLEKIHEEVEKLRSKQDSKSRIISLDSEIRILSAKLADFEETKCNKSRLLTKKTGSSTLLKEERFRKQMQGKFTSKLEQLTVLLRSWMDDEGSRFVPSLLSEEVRMLLDNSDKMESWVEKRTEFMHLRTVQSKSTGKRRITEASSMRHDLQSDTNSQGRVLQTQVNRSKTGASPYQVRPTKVTRISRATSATTSPRRTENSIFRDTASKRKPEGGSKSPIRSKMRRTGQEPAVERNPLSPSLQVKCNIPGGNAVKHNTTLKSDSNKLLPFGHLFSESHTPDKENTFD